MNEPLIGAGLAILLALLGIAFVRPGTSAERCWITLCVGVGLLYAGVFDVVDLVAQFLFWQLLEVL